MNGGTDEGRGHPDSRGVVSRGEGAQAQGRGEGRPWKGVWEVSEEEPFRGLLQQSEWSLSSPPSFPHVEATLGGPVGVESIHATRTLLRRC